MGCHDGYKPEIASDGDGLLIRFSWRKRGGLIPALMLLAISGSVFWALSGFYACLLGGGGSSCYENASDFRILSGVTLLALVCLWRALCGLLNTTIVRVNREGVRFQVRGLPWFGRRFVATEKITGITISERRATSRGGRGTPTYAVGLSRRFGNSTVYGEFFDDKASAEQLAKKIRRALGRD